MLPNTLTPTTPSAGPYIDLHTHTKRSDGKLTVHELLTQAAEVGIGVLALTDHNVTPPDLEELQQQYPTIRLVLDLHRDASGTGQKQLRTAATVAGQTVAQLMLVMGTNYDTWQENFSLAAKLHAQLERQAPGITRPINLRASRFNQDLCPGALLVEVGAAGNTHGEAMLAAEELAKAIVALAKGTGPE